MKNLYEKDQKTASGVLYPLPLFSVPSSNQLNIIEDTLEVVSGYISFRDLIKFGLTTKEHYRLFNTMEFWKNLVKKTFPETFMEKSREHKSTLHWKNIYGERVNQIRSEYPLTMQGDSISAIFSKDEKYFLKTIRHYPYAYLFHFDKSHRRPLDWIYHLMMVDFPSANIYQKMLNHLYARAITSRGALNVEEQQANLSLYDLCIILKQEALLLAIPVENITQEEGLRFILFASHSGDKKWVEFVWNIFANRIDINRNKGCNVTFLNERYFIQNQSYFYTSNFVNPLGQACQQGFVDIVEFLLSKKWKLSDNFRQNLFGHLEKINPVSAAKILFHLLKAGEISPNLLEPFDFSLDFYHISRIKRMLKTHTALLHMILIAKVDLELTSASRGKKDIDNFKRILIMNYDPQKKLSELLNWLRLSKHSGQSIISPQSTLSTRISFLSNVAHQLFEYINQNNINYFCDWNEWIALRYYDYLKTQITENIFKSTVNHSPF